LQTAHVLPCPALFFLLSFRELLFEKEASVQDIKVLIFDLGGVIVKFTCLTKNPAFLAMCSAPKEGVKSFFLGEVWCRYERGQISTGEFAKLAVSNLGYRGTESEFQHDFCEMLGAEIDRDVFDVLDSLKLFYGQHVELWMLSNVNELHYNYLRAKWPGIFSSFLEVFLSFELGERKPGEEIYRKMLGLGKALPEQCLFFDDSAENIHGAWSVGLGARRFSNSVGLRYDLASAGFYTSPRTGR
jgi:putative hydrolase of the HAD superfamily